MLYKSFETLTMLKGDFFKIVSKEGGNQNALVQLHYFKQMEILRMPWKPNFIVGFMEGIIKLAHLTWAQIHKLFILL